MKPEEYVLRATDHYYKGEYDEALRNLDRAIELRSDFAEAWYNKGIVLSVICRHEEEIEVYNKAIELRPDYAEAWNNKSAALGRLGRFDEALNALRSSP